MFPNLPAITVETPPFLDIGGGGPWKMGVTQSRRGISTECNVHERNSRKFLFAGVTISELEGGESAWCGCGCGQGQLEPRKIVETLYGLSLQTQLTGTVWVGDGDVHSGGISTDAREQGIQVTDLCPFLLSADFLGDFRFKPAVVTVVEGCKECFRVLDQ